MSLIFFLGAPAPHRVLCRANAFLVLSGCVALFAFLLVSGWLEGGGETWTNSTNIQLRLKAPPHQYVSVVIRSRIVRLVFRIF